MSTAVQIPDELADRLQPYENDLPQILALGLREWNARQEPGFAGLSSVLETLASLPGPDEVLALRPTAAAQTRIEELLAKNRSTGLSADEKREWDQYQYVEHLVRLAKARAMLRRKGT